MFLPPAIKFTVSRTCNERICRMTTALSNLSGVSVEFALMHRTK